MPEMETDGRQEPMGTLAHGVTRRLLSYMKPYTRTLVAAFVMLAVATAADVLGPVLLKIFIDSYLMPRRFPMGQILALVVGYVGLLTVSASFNYWQLFTFQNVALRIIQRLRVDLFGHLARLSLGYFDGTPAGALVSRVTNDTEAIKDLYVSVLSTFVQNGFLLVGIYIAMFALDVRLAVLCLGISPLILLIMVVYRHQSSRIYQLTRRELARLNARLNESLQGMYLIQAMRQERRMRTEFGEVNEAYRRLRMRNVHLNALLLRPMVDVVYFLALMLVLSFFGLASTSTAVNVGVLYAFVNYLERFFEPINQMMMRLGAFQQATVAAARVFELMDERDTAPGADGMTGGPSIEEGMVSFDRVSFSYDGRTDVLKDISFTAKPGQTVALVGHTGSGKSTVASLLLRFYPATRGRIAIDGVPLDEFSNRELRRRVGLVLQDPFMFVGDVRSNIRIGDDNISDADIEEAVGFVGADRIVARLPAGLGEPVGERGVKFSGGERQLFAFARTMARKPRILVLDEATANVDTETEEVIQEALAHMRVGRTTIAIAHRLSTVQDADLILVLHRGEIVERGTHGELLARGGLYHAMYLLQQGGSANRAGADDWALGGAGVSGPVD